MARTKRFKQRVVTKGNALPTSGRPIRLKQQPLPNLIRSLRSHWHFLTGEPAGR